MQALLKPLLELAEYEDIVKKKKEAPGVLMLTGCVNSQKTQDVYKRQIVKQGEAADRNMSRSIQWRMPMQRSNCWHRVIMIKELHCVTE